MNHFKPSNITFVLLLGLLAWAITPNQACHTTSLPDTDELTQGPYWIDPMLNRTNITEGQQGTPYTLTLRVWNKTQIAAACAATANGNDTDAPITNGVGVMAGVQVDIWHASAPGHYSGFSAEGTSGLTWLRGYQLTNSSGYVTFQTIFPGWYTSRTTHIHIRIRVFNSDGTQVYDDTTQLFFDDTVSDSIYASNSLYSHGSGRDTYNSGDNIYQAVMLVPLTGSSAAGYQSTFNLYYPFATTTSSTTGSGAGGSGAGAGSGPGTGGNGPSGGNRPSGPGTGGAPPSGAAANQTTTAPTTAATPTTTTPTVTPTTTTPTILTPTTSAPATSDATLAPTTVAPIVDSTSSSSSSTGINGNTASSPLISMSSLVFCLLILLCLV